MITIHVIATEAVAFQEVLLPEFADYQAYVVNNARVMAAMLIS
ncbi:hypothetical protein [Photobacterium sp. TY1-4]|nr:hypothetical protein [Photobacterium sp. TY1-4]